ncbi:hypothetical protein FE257_011676 [Aspergillus nanangensis]|uniref:Major facilitator superfamily (MFS) profile domain-containing protein n=1 Tax=Aspergillus nanangensis TaxID=2582783 RepID=A0AAD4GXU4_ASPNN|nr:hypothetical protein FE257_011676 [Aspergillus nanangensis]
MSVTEEKDHTEHDSNVSVHDGMQPSNTAGFTADLDNLPKGYFMSSFFVGTMFAIGTGLAACTGGFGLAAPNLTLINSEIGPDPNINWVSFVYTLTLSVGLLIFGRLTDVFGRRYYLIGGTLLSLIGCIIAATAKNVPSLIVGMALIGLGGSAQQSFSFISNELVPMKYRFIVNSWLYLWTLPTSAFGAAISKAFILYTSRGWRWCYYYLIIFNVISLVLYSVFYFPPTFDEKQETRRTKTEAVRMFDYVGTFLFIAGLVLFQLGLLWGGQVYPWKSVPVIVTLVLGAIILVGFGLWEVYAPLKEPVVPIKLFKNIRWVSACVLLGLGASIYYGGPMAIIWPNMVAIVYTDDGGASMKAGWLNCMPVTLMVAGQILGGGLAAAIGNQRLQCMAVCSAMAYSTPSTLSGTATLLNLSCFLIGWNESVCLTNAGIELEDQRQIGTAVGMAGSIRSAISTVASSVYVVVLNNRMAQTVPTEVPPVLVEAGLPQSSVPAFLQGLSTGSFSGIEGLTPHIQEVGSHAYKVASSHAFQTVYLTSIAFTGVAVILSFWAPTVDDKLTGEIAATLHGAHTGGKDDSEGSEKTQV